MDYTAIPLIFPSMEISGIMIMKWYKKKADMSKSWSYWLSLHHKPVTETQHLTERNLLDAKNPAKKWIW